MDTFDTIVVGSGINSLVCAALLAESGQRVGVFERSAVLGGCIRTEELTKPGFRHDTLSTLYPLFVSAPHFQELSQPLARLGARFVNCRYPTAAVMPDGTSAVLSRDRIENVAEFDRLARGDGAAYRRAVEEVESDASLTFSLLGAEIWTRKLLRIVLAHWWRRGTQSIGQYAAAGLEPSRSWLLREFKSEVSRALIAPWVLHVGLGPESAASALMAKVILFTLEAVGSPMVEGGSANLVQAFARLIEERGGMLLCSADVDRVLISGGSARGVVLSDGREFRARRAVVCNATPTQLYGRLLREASVPDIARAAAMRYRYGRGEMQIHLALDSPPAWSTDRLNHVAMLHVTPGLDAVSRAVNEAERGLLPAEATIVVAQPMVVDASRAPPGKSILWIQLQELPSRVRGDALGEIEIPPDGIWTAALRDRYAHRVIARLEKYIPNLRRSIVGMHAISPKDLEALNVNLVGGDPYSGDCSIDQFLLWRPFFSQNGHATPVNRLYHIGASTHPGPGLGGMSGYLVANQLR